MWVLASFDKAVGKKEEKGPANGNAETWQIKTRDLAIAKVGADESAHHGAEDPNQDGNNHSTGVFPRHEKLGEDSCNEAEHDPGNDAQRRPSL